MRDQTLVNFVRDIEEHLQPMLSLHQLAGLRGAIEYTNDIHLQAPHLDKAKYINDIIQCVLEMELPMDTWAKIDMMAFQKTVVLAAAKLPDLESIFSLYKKVKFFQYDPESPDRFPICILNIFLSLNPGMQFKEQVLSELNSLQEQHSPIPSWKQSLALDYMAELIAAQTLDDTNTELKFKKADVAFSAKVTRFVNEKFGLDFPVNTSHSYYTLPSGAQILLSMHCKQQRDNEAKEIDGRRNVFNFAMQKSIEDNPDNLITRCWNRFAPHQAGYFAGLAMTAATGVALSYRLSY